MLDHVHAPYVPRPVVDDAAAKILVANFLGRAPSAIERLAALTDAEIRERVDAYDHRRQRLIRPPRADFFQQVKVSNL